MTLIAADGTRLYRRYVIANQARALPDGDFLACTGTNAGTIRIVDFAATDEHPKGHEGELRTLEWTSSGALFSCSNEDQRILLTDRRTGEIRPLDISPEFEIRCAARGPREIWLIGHTSALRWCDDGTSAPALFPADRRPVESLHVSADGQFALARRAASHAHSTLERWKREGDGWTFHSHLVAKPLADHEFNAVALSPRGDRWIQPPTDEILLDDDGDDDDDDDDDEYGYEQLMIQSETGSVPILVGGYPYSAQLSEDLALIASPRRIMLFDSATGQPRAMRRANGVYHALLAPHGLVVSIREPETHGGFHLDFLRGSDLELLHTQRLPLQHTGVLLAIGGPDDWLAVGSVRGEIYAYEVDWDMLARLTPLPAKEDP